MDFISTTGQTFQLYESLDATTSYATIDFLMSETPLWTNGIVKIDTGEQSEFFVFSALANVSGNIYRGTVVSRGLKNNAVNELDVDTSLQKTHSAGASCTIVTHSLEWNQKTSSGVNIDFSGDNTVTGTLDFTGTTEAGLKLQQVTTAQRDSLTGTGIGQIVYNDTTDAVNVKDNGGNWDALATGSTNPNASETAKGKVGLGTVAEQIAATQDTKVVQTRYLVHTLSGPQSNRAGRIVLLDATGTIPYFFLPDSAQRWGGSSSDGILSGSVTITGSNNSVIIKNYQEITAGAFTMSITPTNCFLWIKVRGNCDLTGWTIDVSGKGLAGGLSGNCVFTSSPTSGTSGSGTVMTTYSYIGVQSNNTGGGGGTASASVAGTASVPYGIDENFMESARVIALSCGEGGSGGGGGYNKTVTGSPVAGTGTGGNGGGCIFFEVAGNLTFSGTTVNVSGTNGGTGSIGSGDGINGFHASGGGGGGGGGTALFMYNGTLTGSPTTVVSGGTGGAAGDDTNRPNAGYGGAGGAGGSNVYTQGSNGSSGTTTTAGAGGNGATGKVIVLKNTIF